MGNGLTSLQVCEATGLTYRRLDYWVRTELIEPIVDADGSGSQRLFDPSVVDQIREMQRRIDACPFDHRS